MPPAHAGIIACSVMKLWRVHPRSTLYIGNTEGKVTMQEQQQWRQQRRVTGLYSKIIAHNIFIFFFLSFLPIYFLRLYLVSHSIRRSNSGPGSKTRLSPPSLSRFELCKLSREYFSPSYSRRVALARTAVTYLGVSILPHLEMLCTSCP